MPNLRHTFQTYKNTLSVLLGFDELSTRTLSASASRKLRRMQICGSVEQMRILHAGNTLFAPALSFQAWNMGVNSLVLAWTAVILTYSWVLLLQWRVSVQTNGDARDMQRFVTETQVNAGLWCMGMALFYPMVDGIQQTIIISIMVGSLALGTVGFSQAPRAAMWYLAFHAVTIVFVPLAVGLTQGRSSEYLISVLALASSIGVFNAVRERARAQMRAFKTMESLTQKTEVIDLLLKDYEEQGVEWVWRTNEDGKLLSAPQQVLTLMAVQAPEDLAISLPQAIIDRVDPEGEIPAGKVCAAFAEKKDFHDVVLPFRESETEQTRWIMMRGRAHFEEGQFVGFRGIFADATKTIEAQRQIEFLATHDPLTGTYNRNQVQDHLNALDPSIDQAMVYLIDLDGFKQVNDGYGHSVGDQLLQFVADRLKKIAGEDALVARLGGDEFLLVTPGCTKHEYLNDASLSNQVLVALSQRFAVGRFDIALSASIGTAHFPRDTKDGSTLLNLADLALYAAKRGGRNRCLSFSSDMQVGLQQRLIVTDRLRLAVAQNKVTAFYQPQHCAKTGHIVGFEALARWTDSQLGTVGPDIFIPIAEETGLIQVLGAQLLHKACLDAKDWSANSNGDALRVSVNVSPIQVTRGDIVATVQTALQQTGLPPHLLEIEITESVLIGDMERTCETLRDLAHLGVSIALDDFGTGYSSLSYIRALPLHRLKIDRSFVLDLDDAEARSVVQAIVDLCRRLNLDVIAEGVESQNCAALLESIGCDILQGYHFSRPLPQDETLEYSQRPDFEAMPSLSA